MSAPRLDRVVLVALACFVGVNVCVELLGRRSIPRQLLARIDAAHAPDLVATGNSLVAAGLDEAALAAGAQERGVTLRPLGVGLGASGPIAHLILARRALHAHQGLGTLVYGFSDLQLTAPPEPPWWRALGNDALVLYGDPEVGPRLAASRGPLERAAFRAAACVPVFVERAGLWARVERLRRGLGGLGVPPVAEARFGRVEDFLALERASDDAWQRALAAAGTALNAPVAELVETGRARGARVVLVSMPRTSTHRRRCFDGPAWSAYLDAVRAEAARAGAELLDAAAWIEDDRLFEDGVHLGAEGARAFSRRLGRELAAR